MRGRIIFVNPATSTGLIFGADRERYRFLTTSWTEPGLPPRNAEVSFRTKNGEALSIKYFSPDDPAYSEIEDASDADPLDRFMSATPVASSTTATAKGGRDKADRIAPSVEPFAEKPPQAAAEEPEEEDMLGGAGQAGEDEEESLYDFNLTDELEKRDRPVLSALPPTGKILFSQDGVGSRRSSLRYYLIGLAAALLFILAGIVYTHIVHAGS